MHQFRSNLLIDNGLNFMIKYCLCDKRMKYILKNHIKLYETSAITNEKTSLFNVHDVSRHAWFEQYDHPRSLYIEIHTLIILTQLNHCYLIGNYNCDKSSHSERKQRMKPSWFTYIKIQYM